MVRRTNILRSCTALLAATALASAQTVALAEGDEKNKTKETAANEKAEEMADVKEEVSDAAKVVDQMRQDPQLTELMRQAEGIFVVPHFGRGGLVVGAHGGSGVMLSHENGEWSDPAFYDMGGLSVGAQAGGAAGAVVFLLMSDKAVEQFHKRDSFSLDADAGITIVDYSTGAQASAGKGDIVLWTNMEGAFAGAEIGVSDVAWDEEANLAYYEEEVAPEEILTEQRGEAPDNELKDSLPE